MLRITATAEHLSKLSPEKAAVVERRMLALAIAMTPEENDVPSGTSLEDFHMVDEIEAKLIKQSRFAPSNDDASQG